MTAGPVVFAYDGCDLAKHAIESAAGQLAPGRDAVVLTVWEPFDVGFIPAGGEQFDAASAPDVKRAAEHTAAEGASIATAAGFSARGDVVRSSPTWKGIVEFADEHDASLIVLGSHSRKGIAGRLVGSVARCVAAHSGRSVLIVHARS